MKESFFQHIFTDNLKFFMARFWLVFGATQFRIRFLIRPNDTDPYGSGYTTLQSNSEKKISILIPLYLKNEQPELLIG